jgi:AraC-like DNA-binding protein
VLARIEDGLAAPPDLAELASLAGLSRCHVVRAVKAATGATPHALVLDRKVRAARTLLRAGEPAAAVAQACGFADQAHLTRTFKARLGVPPAAFARAGRA